MACVSDINGPSLHDTTASRRSRADWHGAGRQIVLNTKRQPTVHVAAAAAAKEHYVIKIHPFHEKDTDRQMHAVKGPPVMGWEPTTTA